MIKNKKAVEVIPPRKLNSVKELLDLIKSKKTVLVASIKNIPASQFQEIGKKIRSKAKIKVPKKNLIFRAIDESKNENLKDLKKEIKESSAILFSDLDSYDLALELIKKKTPAKAKPGQIAPMDIEIKAGMTDLVPGPAISELGSVGIITKVTNGKLEITQDKIIVKQGDKIKQNVSDVMAKLDIKPFSIGFTPLASYDTKENKLYLEIKIDSEEEKENLKNCFSKALAFAVSVGYTCKDTISFMITKAAMHEKALNNLEPKEEKVEEIKEEVKEEKKEDTQSQDGGNN